MFFWIKSEFGKIAGFVASIFYLYAPYHLIDIHFRASIGEILSFAILPYAFFMMKQITKNGRGIYMFLHGVILSCLILSHLPTSVFSFPILFFYGVLLLFQEKKINFQSFFSLLIPFILSFLFTAFYTLPLLYESKYIIFSRPHIDFFPTYSYIFAPVRFGLLFQGHQGELYPILGYIQWVVIFGSIILLFLKDISSNSKRLLIFFLVIFFMLFFLMQQISLPIWNALPFLKDIQFSYRIMLELSLLAAVVAGIVAQELYRRKKLIVIFILCFLAITSTILNWGNRQTEPAVTDAVLQKQSVSPEIPGVVEVTTPIWVNIHEPWIGIFPKAPIEILSGNATIHMLLHNQTRHEYLITVSKRVLVKENTYYFPGWKLFVNSVTHAITYTNKKYSGIVVFSLSPGKYHVRLQFLPTAITSTARVVSEYTFLLALLLFLALDFFERKSSLTTHDTNPSHAKKHKRYGKN